VVTPPPALERRDLIQAADAYAAAYAAGAAPPASGRAMVGRTFRVQIPFGCDGPQTAYGGAPAYFEYDPQKNSLRFLARPASLAGLPLIQKLGDADRIEAVEGFWIPRPWTQTDACPPRHDDPPPATPTPPAAQTVGLARIFDKGDSRLLQRAGRPYEFVRKLTGEDLSPLSHTYRLVLEGPIVGYSDGSPIHCWAESPDHRPICLFAVELDRVAMEDATTDKLLAEWRE
jgi:hypothetical protein